MNYSLVLRFALRFLLFQVVILGVAAYPVISLGSIKLFHALWQSFLVFYLITTGAFIISTYKTRQNREMMQMYMLSIGLKMLIGLIYFVVMLKNYKGFELPFALCFFCGYLVSTGFELYYLLINLRQISDGANNAKK